MALIALVCALFAPAVAGAETFIVNSAGEGADETPGDEFCRVAGTECTLRAAIEEANALLGEFDLIEFDEDVFDGQMAGTIPAGSLPTIVEGVSIFGECTVAEVIRPCVGVDGASAAAPALSVENANFVAIGGLALTGAETGIDVVGSESFKAAGNWLGVKLDRSAGGNSTGISLDPQSNGARIGGEGATARNVFANNSGDGLDILGADNVEILGNYFGVGPDGVTEAKNGKDIEITSVFEGSEAIGNSIGNNVGSIGAGSPACDRGCNLISGSSSSGIDLEGDGAEEAPAVATTIAGNYVGLNVTGTAAVPNAAAGIRVGAAPRTVIGGPRAGERNRLNGGSVAVLAGPAAEDLIVLGNTIGTDATGTATLAPPADGIVVDSEAIPGPTAEAFVADNRIRMAGGVAIAQGGIGAWILGNEIFGAANGIRVHGIGSEHGNLIEGNTIAGSGVSGILVENNNNELFGNQVVGTGEAGIRVNGALFAPFGVNGNQIGGDEALEENLIDGGAGDAIEIVNFKTSRNEVRRNRGSANGGLFIDLVAVSPGAEEPPNAVEPPEILVPIQASVGGGAKPGATVRVFRKQSAELGELGSFLGEATADAEGNWNVIYGGAIPVGTIVAATQTSEGGTSELTTATTIAESGGGSSESGGGGGGAGSASADGDGAGDAKGPSADVTPPKTKILKTPKKQRHRPGTARFEFGSNEPGSVFLCKLDGRSWVLCKSPRTYRNLKPGRHVFRVRSIDRAGNVDSSPAKRTFAVFAES